MTSESQELLARLKDRSLADEERIVAIRLAGDVTVLDDSLAESLLGLVKADDEPDDVRGAAAIALGPVLEDCDAYGADDEDMVGISEDMFDRLREGLRQIVTDTGQPVDVRRRALEASVRAPEEWHVSQVRKAFASDDPLWKITGVFCMGFVPGFEEDLLATIEHDDDELAGEALRAAGNQVLDDAFETMRETALDEEVSLVRRIGAIEGLAGFMTSEASDLLADLSESGNPEIADAAEHAHSLCVPLDGSDDEAYPL